MRKYDVTTKKEISNREIEHRNLVRSFAPECMVLLENNGVLPLQEATRVALYGSGARATMRGGTGSGEVNSRHVVSVEQGLEEAGFTIQTKEWLDAYETKKKCEEKLHLEEITKRSVEEKTPLFFVEFNYPMGGIADIVIEEKVDADLAIYVIARKSGEGADLRNVRGEYQLFEEEKKNLEFLAKNYKKVVLVLNIGQVLQMDEVLSIQGIDAIILMGQLGNIGGYALSDVLLGKASPSGKLTDTWALDYADYPSSAEFSINNGNVDDEYYKDGIFVGYRYFDSVKKKVCYPFGYGKTYTEFLIETVGVTQEGVNCQIDVAVKNVGKYEGMEVIQAYVSAPVGQIQKPFQELRGFAKTKRLQPNEETIVSISFPFAALASYSEKEHSWLVEKGDYLLRIGNDSKNTNCVAVISFEKTVVTEICDNLYPLDHDFEEISIPCNWEQEMMAEIEQVKFHLEPDFYGMKCKINEYTKKHPLLTTNKTYTITLKDVLEKKATMEELVAQLSVAEMADLCVGSLRFKEGETVGNASYEVPGAAGDSTSKLKDSRGIKNLVTADGPAGLRLQPIFKTTKDGELIPGGGGINGVITPFETDLPDEELNVYYQYTTAIPIGWNLAQSWNLAGVEALGDIIGKEMELFHVDIWLAPALNIHRNPLCGRNFEYYSEDPYISGKMAAAITKGVQKYKGRGVTIKHFAANNQEENRYSINIHVKERALREIYLKGFEIAIKESNPVSVMTSYNLLNGIHTANHRDLIQKTLRDEWGFSGFVMSDWNTSCDTNVIFSKYKPVYPISSSPGCIYAGNDLQMPGSEKNVQDIIEAVESGELALEDLQFCALNVGTVLLP